MKKRISVAALAMLIAVCASVSAIAAGIGAVRYTNTYMLAPNLTYTDTVAWLDGVGREESHALTLSPGGDVYPIVLGGNTVYGGATIDAVRNWAESRGHNVLALMNADFFSLSSGVPIGILISNGKYLSSPGGEGAVAFGAGGGAYITGRAEVSMTLKTASGDVSVPHLNKMSNALGGIYLFTEEFSTVSARTSGENWFVRFRILSGELAVNSDVALEVTETFVSDSAPPIGAGNMLLACVGAGDESFAKFFAGQTVTLQTRCEDAELSAAAYATGCGDVLISGGEITDSTGWDGAISGRNPRSAIGIKADGGVVALAIDGRDSTISQGATMRALAETLLELGCVSAANLDGGGSTAISVRTPGSAAAAVKNHPSDGALRKCATYIAFVTDARPGGAAKSLALVNNGAPVLSGAKLTLRFAAADSGYAPVAPPDDLTYTSARLDGTAFGSGYVASGAQGTDRLELYSPSLGIYGYGEVFVVTAPTSISVTAGGKEVTKLAASPGDVIPLVPRSTFYRMSVESTPTCYTYAVIGDIGEVLPDGTFRAGNCGEGKIRVAAGGTATEIAVSVTGFSDVSDHWSREFVQKLYNAGVVSGMGGGKFNPDADITRRDFILMLYKAAGGAPVSAGRDFDDVLPGTYYYDAVMWALQNGITNGAGDNRFNPGGTLTRQDAFAFIYRAQSVLNVYMPDGDAEILSAFLDADALAEYAKIPAATLMRAGIAAGSGGALNPRGNLARGQMAKILWLVMTVNG
ncbi:MAG: phosphodiester glycosidase family protein [Oscillospiraceae bacterium]|jgi:hypothetical protein|nr:phosphodiester glycosidase family protein [Oscillospiraceae bacterium]